MEKLDFEDLLRQWIATMGDYEYETLIHKLEQYRATEYYEESAQMQLRREDVRETLYNLLARADGAAILAPWLEQQPIPNDLTCSEWLKKAKLYGFGKGMDTASAKSIFLRKIEPLVKKRIVIKTIKGYMLARGVRSLIRDLQEFPEDYKKIIEE